MSGNCTVTAGYTLADEAVTLSKLNLQANPTVQVDEDAITVRELDLVDLSSAVGTGFNNASYLQNGHFETPAWSGGGPITATAGSDSILARHWRVRPDGASVTQERSGTVPNNNSLYSLRITGGSGVTTVDLAQNIPSYAAAKLRNTITYSIYIYNSAGAAVIPTLRIDTADALDNFSAVTNVSSTTLPSIATGVWTQIKTTINATALSNMGNGARIVFRLPSGSMDANTKHVLLSQPKLELGSNATPLGLAITDVPDYLSAGTTKLATVTADDLGRITAVAAGAVSSTDVIDYPSISGETGSDATIAVSGAAVNDAVAIGLPTSATDPGIIYTAYVSAADTVTINAYNTTTDAVDIPSGTYRATVFKD